MKLVSDFAPLPAAAELTQDSAFARLWRAFMTARVGIALVLLALLAALHLLAPAFNVSGWLVALGFTYLAAVVAVRLFTRPRPPGSSFDPQWVSTIGIDLVAFATLQFLQAGGINYSPLFALPVLMGSVLGSTLLALGTAAGVTLLLLTDAWVLSLHAPDDSATRFLQAALTGTGYFALSLLVNQMAVRLSREEHAARQGQRAARAQAQVNQLVIETLSDGVLVVDAKWRVHAANPAAQALLGLPHAGPGVEFALSGQPAWEPLAALARTTFRERTPQSADIAMSLVGDETRRLHVRSRLTNPDSSQFASLCVMFVQDLRELEGRLRTEKLAAMGRMSAAVAHEIRNPLAAIAQANALMDEDLREPALRQLSALVRKNTQRLAQIVDEILNVAQNQPGDRAAAPRMELDPAVAGVCGDWAMQTRSSERLQVALGAPGARVRFEAPHLRRVLVNLLDNALRYAGGQPDSIRVATALAEGQPVLTVWSDGAPLSASVEQRLFEPFFSSESRSSGLGLYICRELCERHGAAIGYRRRAAGSGAHAREGNEFFVSFGPARSKLAGAAPFDTMAA
ncbi:sensor histidine kinase [Ramlibacter sp.]|uniref:sensor histidine kinase n=1 Tax=Ramlibacter sp. TaxID=1917967 RepID=UPI002B87B7A1|nr:ATP-binding protein [Ramlibacter sp.]HWI84404.1 ATP-binding protein [Ramlibacter sp.]